MAQPYVGEIRMFGGNFAPTGWEFCNGQLLAIANNETLFQLIGTTYGGDGQSTFAMPDLRGRVPVHQGAGLTLAENGGTESVTLTVNQLPVHSHPALGSVNPATSNNPQNNVPASLSAAGTQSAYGTLPPFVNLDPTSVSPVGGSQPHDNMQPYLCISFIISKFGIFPSPT
jgi:microcystin-dependent protein